jgi:GT2 family glycosyltransferase
MAKVSLCVLAYNGYDMTHALLGDILQKCRGAHEVIVMDNGSTEDTERGLQFWKAIYKPITFRIVAVKNNLGFVGGWNHVLPQATGDFVVALSNDVRIRNRQWFQGVQDIADSRERVLLGGAYYGFDTGWNKFGDELFPYMEGWCIGMSRDGWKELGYFDERYAPSDFEDVDLSTAATQAGYRMAVVDGAQHIGGGTYGYNPEREARTKRNQQLFREKWNVR